MKYSLLVGFILALCVCIATANQESKEAVEEPDALKAEYEALDNEKNEEEVDVSENSPASKKKYSEEQITGSAVAISTTGGIIATDSSASAASLSDTNIVEGAGDSSSTRENITSRSFAIANALIGAKEGCRGVSPTLLRVMSEIGQS